MMLPKDGKLLRIFIGENDKHGAQPLFEWIVQQARKHGLAGATVLRGLEGFGAHSRLHTAKVLRLSADLPIIIEIVDTGEKIESFMPLIDDSIRAPLREEMHAHCAAEFVLYMRIEVLDAPLFLCAVVDHHEGNLQVLEQRAIPNITEIVVADDADVRVQFDHLIQPGYRSRTQTQSGDYLVLVTCRQYALLPN